VLGEKQDKCKLPEDAKYEKHKFHSPLIHTFSFIHPGMKHSPG